MNETTTPYVIKAWELNKRTCQDAIERALVRLGYTEAADTLHKANPRDLAEIWQYVPQDAPIRLEVAP